MGEEMSDGDEFYYRLMSRCGDGLFNYFSAVVNISTLEGCRRLPVVPVRCFSASVFGKTRCNLNSMCTVLETEMVSHSCPILKEEV